MRLRPKLRLDVISGFLGSGKTSLLRRHLAAMDPSVRVAVIINEFGEISIDHRLMRSSGDAARVVSSGCACCTVADQLRETLLDLLREDASGTSTPIDRIVLETSGLADPATIFNTVRSDLALSEYLEAGRCVVAFDVLDGVTYAGRYQESRHQLAAADTIALTKADIADSDAIVRAHAFARAANPLAELAISTTVDFGIEHLFSGAASVPREVPSSHLHAGSVNSFCLSLRGPIDWASFSVWLTSLLYRHGPQILRFKGVLDLGSAQGLLVIHGVRHLVYPPEHLPHPGTADMRSDLVFIVDGLEPRQIDESLRRFLLFAARTTSNPAHLATAASR